MPRVAITGVPEWVPTDTLLGPGDWVRTEGAWTADLSRPEAADVQARLRGIGLGGMALEVTVRPSLKRTVVRAARTADARRRRDTSVGFSRSGVQLDPEGRMSLTPEALALALGRRAQGRTVIDATAGAGGNAIGFARAGCPVIAVDVDPERLRDARHNARVYGVADKITFVAGDALAELPNRAGAIVFVDPPWGADWDRRCTRLAGFPLLEAILRTEDREVWAKVPPSFAVADIPDGVPEAWFGVADGDARRVKFVVVRRPSRDEAVPQLVPRPVR